MATTALNPNPNAGNTPGTRTATAPQPTARKTDPRNRERRLRDLLSKAGLRLRKAPSRHWTRSHYPTGFMILQGDLVVAGARRREFELSLAEAEAAAIELIATETSTSEPRQ
jgi:hypothetical protein